MHVQRDRWRQSGGEWEEEEEGRGEHLGAAGWSNRSIEDGDRRAHARTERADRRRTQWSGGAKNDLPNAVRGAVGGYADGADGCGIGVDGPAAMNLNDCHTKSALDRDGLWRVGVGRRTAADE